MIISQIVPFNPAYSLLLCYLHPLFFPPHRALGVTLPLLFKAPTTTTILESTPSPPTIIVPPTVTTPTTDNPVHHDIKLKSDSPNSALGVVPSHSTNVPTSTTSTTSTRPHRASRKVTFF